MEDHNGARRDLRKKLGQRRQRQAVIQHTDHQNNDGTQQNSLHLQIQPDKQEGTQQKGDHNGKSAQTGDRHFVHPAVIPGHIHRADPEGQPFDKRRCHVG